jgi:membrane protein implicated in regulation of membrane protease activity
VFAWNGLISWWIDMVVFGLYTGVFIVLLRRMIQREDFGTGLLPDLAATTEPGPPKLSEKKS